MNILISHHWLKEFVQIHQSPEQLMRRLSLSGPTVDRMKRMTEEWEKIVVGKVIESKKHPNADRLTVNTVDIGGKRAEIVCGAPNVKEGMLAVVALPGALVRWHGEGDRIELTVAKVRGVESHGMMCAASEIGLEKYPDADKGLPRQPQGKAGIMDISWTNAKPGMPLAEALDMDDVLFDVEVTSNRPDMYSMAGIAREAAAILKTRLLKRAHDAFVDGVPTLKVESDEPVALKVKVDAAKACPRFTGVVMTNVKVGPSPKWMQHRLLLAGHRPINNIVDITNYVMVEYGKPLHAFDADTLQKQAGGAITLHVRNAKNKESIKALDGKAYELDPSALVIADTEQAVAIAGVMGGEATGVTEKTNTIVFESAVFDPVRIRQTARALHLHSDASHMFEKGLESESTVPALLRAVALAKEMTGARVASPVADTWGVKVKPHQVTLREESVERCMGVPVSLSEIKQALTALGFTMKVANASKGRAWVVGIPWWRRRDVTIEEDVIEEIARVYGYERIPSRLPEGELVVQDREDRKPFVWERRVKGLLRGAGWTEVMSYSFTSEKIIRALGYEPAAHVEVENPLSDEFVYMREDLIGSLLPIIEQNQGVRGSMRIFEIAKVYKKTTAVLPDEPVRLAGVRYERTQGDAVRMFREVRGALEFVLRSAGITENRLTFEVPTDTRRVPWVDPSKNLACLVDGEIVGYICMPKQEVLRAFGVDGTVTYFAMRFGRLLRFVRDAKQYAPIPKFPPIERDIAFAVPRTVRHADIVALIRTEPFVTSVELFDLYEGKQVEEGKKSMAYHVEYRAADRTLKKEEVDAVERLLVEKLQKSFNAIIRDK